MPGRQAHGRPLTAKPKLSGKAKVKKRALDAFVVASHQVSEKPRVKKHRLGAREGGERPGKRRRDDDDDDEDDEEEVSSKKQRKGPEKGRFDELDLDEGSDSEGNEWKLGQVDSDDDSDLDSDEAFGESDEERFEGFAFSGSTDKRLKKKQNGSAKDLNLDEDEEEESDSELEEGDLGEGAVDLADMLNSSSDDGENPKKNGKDLKGSHNSDSSEDSDDDGESIGFGSDEDMDDVDEETSASSEDEDNDPANPHKIAELQNLIQTLSQADAQITDGSKRRRGGLSLSDPLAQPVASTGKVKKSKAPLAVPLERRQQDRLDRSAAYDKSKETLGRWTETVKHNREAEHLMFPLPDNDTASAKNNQQLMPTTQSKPFNDLEATIQSILEESGLATANGKDDEDHLREFEELEANKMSLEEVKARRDQLRMARDLLFREEAKAKRIKKIKSKAYRKVHRKQREKEERANQEALAEGGYEMSEDELEKQDRRRAEERMGGKHKNSKWAKAMKESGRTAWDTDVMSGVTEMARKDEELRKRVEGKVVRKEFDDDSDASSNSSDESEDDSEAEQRRLLKRLQKVGGDEILDESAPGARLANLKFMTKAEASRKQENDALVESIRKDLAGDESDSEPEGDVGRRLFGPAGIAQQPKSKSKARDNFEEGENSDAEDTTQAHASSKQSRTTSTRSKDSNQLSSVTSAEATRRRHKKNNDLDVTIDLSQNLTAAQPKTLKPKPKTKKATQTLHAGSDNESDSDDVESTIPLPFAIKDQDLIKRAFAGADVVGEFEDEKRQTIIDEDEKVVDNTIPGWGSWTGDGLSKKERAKNKGRFLTKTKGIKATDRKDARLEKVIINEKKVKKNDKYLASSLPHPFETRAQYERSLRLPIGQEWSTKATFQDATKPRILLKQGVIAPMSKPLL